MGKNISLADIVGSQYLLEILRTSLDSENVVESGCFERHLWWNGPIFDRNEGGI